MRIINIIRYKSEQLHFLQFLYINYLMARLKAEKNKCFVFIYINEPWKITILTHCIRASKLILTLY